MYNAYITRLKNVRPHPNAQKLQLADCFTNTVCVGLDAYEEQLVCYFPTDGQLSEEFCAQHNLVRRKDEAGNQVGGYMDPAKRNIKTIRLRGEPSDGLAMDVGCLEYTGVDMSTLTEGTSFTVINGHEICQKYIPRGKRNCGNGAAGNKTRKKKAPIAPLFAEHADTEQLVYNLGAFKPGDEVEITLKMHGTSQRTGYLPVLQGYKRTLWDRICRKEGTPIYDYGYVSGTRRVVLESYEGGFYGDNPFREQHSKIFEGKLQKGETVYYEVVGFTDSGTPIMGDSNKNEALGKDFVKQYGKTTTFSYGCHPEGKKLVHGYDETGPFSLEQEVPQSDIYVYRMTMINPDGFVVEYSPEFMRYRCEQMAIKCAPLLWKGIIPETELYHTDEYVEDHYGGYEEVVEEVYVNAGEWIQAKAEEFYDGPDPIGKTHVREGVVIRRVNAPKFSAYKHKNLAFKILEGIVKETAAAPDMEEAQEEE